MWKSVLSSRNPDAANAYIGLGGNVGDVRAHMAAALDRLDAVDGVSVVETSALYKTPPWGVTNQPWFINSCAALNCTIPPIELLRLCLETERALKRVRIKRWGPRTIDLDVLLIDGFRAEGEGFSVPHPRMHERAFVMVPMSDIAPRRRIKGRAVSTWARELPREGMELLEPEGWWRKG